MRLRYNGWFTVPKKRSDVYEFLVNPERFAKAFPGFRRVELLGEGEFEVDLLVNIGPLRGDAIVVGRFIDVKEGSYVKIAGRGRGAGSTIDFILELSIADDEAGSKIEWVFEGTVGGLAAFIGDKVLDSIARGLVNDIVEGIRRELST